MKVFAKSDIGRAREMNQDAPNTHRSKKANNEKKKSETKKIPRFYKNSPLTRRTLCVIIFSKGGIKYGLGKRKSIS